jgi:hypothetical protein
MLKHRLSWLAALACVHVAGVMAQDRGGFGPLPSPGDTAEKSPVLERYDLDKLGSIPSGNGQLAATLDAVNRPEAELRLRGAREIELFRTLAPGRGPDRHRHRFGVGLADRYEVGRRQ